MTEKEEFVKLLDDEEELKAEETGIFDILKKPIQLHGGRGVNGKFLNSLFDFFFFQNTKKSFLGSASTESVEKFQEVDHIQGMLYKKIFVSEKWKQKWVKLDPENLTLSYWNSKEVTFKLFKCKRNN